MAKNSISFQASAQAADAVWRSHAFRHRVGSSLAGKRVAMVTFSLFPEDPRPRRAAEAYVREGATVDLICVREGDAPRRESLAGIDVCRIPFNKVRGGKVSYIYQYSLFILISSTIVAFRSLNRKYDIVHVHNMPDVLVLSALIPKARGAKVILDLHDPMPELMMTIFHKDQGSIAVRLLKRLEKWSVARANLVLAVNVACKRIFSGRSCSEDKIAVVMNSPDARFSEFRDASCEHSARPGHAAFTVMYHGSLVERNGLDLAVDAFAEVKEAFPAAELRIYGNKTEFLECVMEKARHSGLGQAIRFFGWKGTEEITEEIKRCDLGVIPNPLNSFTEINTPTRIFEYLALGKPVVAPSTPGIRDYFDETSLLFFEAGNPKHLADQMKYAFAHPREMREIVRRGQDVYKAHSWEQERELFLRRVVELLNSEPA